MLLLRLKGEEKRLQHKQANKKHTAEGMHGIVSDSRSGLNPETGPFRPSLDGAATANPPSPDRKHLVLRCNSHSAFIMPNRVPSERLRGNWRLTYSSVARCGLVCLCSIVSPLAPSCTHANNNSGCRQSFPDPGEHDFLVCVPFRLACCRGLDPNRAMTCANSEEEARARAHTPG